MHSRETAAEFVAVAVAVPVRVDAKMPLASKPVRKGTVRVLIPCFRPSVRGWMAVIRTTLWKRLGIKGPGEEKSIGWRPVGWCLDH